MRKLLRVTTGSAWFGILMAGCAPNRFEQAVSFYAEQYRVSNARARRSTDHWHLRFDELMISDLDDVIEQSDEAELRKQAADVLRATNGLGETVTLGEMDRMPVAGRADLARLAGTDDSPEALRSHYRNLSRAALEELLASVETLPAGRLRETLRKIRRGIELVPDDRGRLWRQCLLACGAIPAWIGAAAVEKTLDEERPEKMSRVFDRAIVWRPVHTGDKNRLKQFAPTIVMEWPDKRPYPEDSDRIGEVSLSGTWDDIDVDVDTSKPVVYTYTSVAKVHGRRYPQLVYSWWFPRHPEMKAGDVAAGDIDGNSVRITLDAKGRPAVFEFVQSCGCNHTVFVSQQMEKASRRAFGSPMPGKQLAVEKDVRGKRDLIVGGTFDVSEEGAHAVVYLLAGCHELSRVEYTADEKVASPSVAKQRYAMSEYGVLERLPLSDGVGSMFGPDGLVHKAGRTEGYLLAPTGILSAGQPRQRGTQKIRWDDYSFADPTLLARALRLPEDF